MGIRNHGLQGKMGAVVVDISVEDSWQLKRGCSANDVRPRLSTVRGKVTIRVSTTWCESSSKGRYCSSLTSIMQVRSLVILSLHTIPQSCPITFTPTDSEVACSSEASVAGNYY